MGQGRLSLSGVEVRRQRHKHRPCCLDLLSLSACFVSMQKNGGWGLVVYQLHVFETQWQHQVA